ncbi:hypothetical protein K432DRAFT_379490 [Lepidopterella palustris CBS 459.81]|uniref:Uncharacterized protein n=1 Tax=Lepidopterella palustris CBS 459.81 TaxID=1314670 RepID=A0A8E2EGG3_9PEZI|nr:hypothetical protein K432DRAFT_379490 [Lepidopterella palustris CBS 459.81]
MDFKLTIPPSLPNSGLGYWAGDVANRNSRMSGSRTWAQSRGDGIDWALTLNTDEFPDERHFLDLCEKGVTGWLDTDPTV